MGFAFPLALLALAGIAGPILAHLVRRRNLPRIVLPSIFLLERAVAESRHRRRVEDVPLLSLRIAVLVALALAFAAPYVLVSVAAGDGSVAALALVIDDSRSMAASRGTSTSLDHALERAEAAARRLPVGSEVTVVLAGSPPRVLVDRLRDPERAAAAIRAMPRSAVRGDALARAVDVATRRLASSSLGTRRLVVYSDFASHVALERLSFPPGVATELVRVVPDATANAGVGVEAVGSDPDREGHLLVRARVLSDVSSAFDAKLLSPSGEVLAATRVDRSTTPRALSFSVAAPREDDVFGEIRLDVADALEDDDRTFVRLRLPDEIHVVFIDGDPHPSRRDDEVGFASRALELAPPTEGRFRVETTDVDRVDPTRLAAADVVVLANVRGPKPALAEALGRFVAGGGGLFVTLGDQVSGPVMVDRLGAVLPARIGTRITRPDTLGVSIEGAVEGFDAAGLSGVRVAASHELEPSGGDARVLARLDDGTPLLVQGTHGRGRVLLLGCSIDDDDSDLPLRGGYLPALVRFARALSRSASTVAPRLAPGSSVALPRLAGLHVLTPSGRDLALSPGASFTATDEVGPYRVTAANGRVPGLDFVVEAPLAESVLRQGPLPRVPRATGRGSGASALLPRDTSPWVFLALGLLLVAEGAARAYGARKRASTTRATLP
ncbi:MAG: vWA domain-containing protein [Polyangiales bacterium]